MGALGWPPSAFWDANLSDLIAALEGMNELNGGDEASRGPAPMTRAEAVALVAAAGKVG